MSGKCAGGHKYEIIHKTKRILIQAEGLEWGKDSRPEAEWGIQRMGSISVSLKQGSKQQRTWQTGQGKLSIFLYFTPFTPLRKF